MRMGDNSYYLRTPEEMSRIFAEVPESITNTQLIADRCSIDLEKKGYINQIQFANSQALAIVDQILANSKTPPIIIIQGDHGLEVGERNLILNAIYLPEAGRDDLYSSISPVNTFRVIFDNYFNADLPLLPDNSFYSKYEDKLAVTPVDDPFASCSAK